MFFTYLGRELRRRMRQAVFAALGESGTLKALGWRSRRIAGQVMGEAVAAVLLPAALAIADGLTAGGFGSWRAARLRPAAALARVQ